MSSAHPYHALEGRDWHGIHKGLAAGGVMINRLHLPCYTETSGKQYYVDFNRVPFLCRSLLPADTVIYPELENGAFSAFAKEARFLQFQLESALPLCIKGMTYDIYDFVGNGAVHNFGYGPVIKGITPYLNKVISLNLRYNALDGIILPMDEKTAYKSGKKITQFQDMFPDESHFSAYISSLGLTTKPSLKKAFKGKIVALGGGNVYNFTAAQLSDLFKNNFVIVDGGAACHLIDRGLGDLIGANGYEILYAECDKHSYEEVREDIIINGKKGYRATAFGRAGNYVKIDYKTQENAQSFVYDYLGNKMGVGDVNGGNYFVIPYIINGMHIEQYNDLRTTLLRRFLQGTGVRLVSTNYAGVYAYLYRQNKKCVLIVVNSTESDFDTTNLEIQNLQFTKMYAIHRKNGRKVPVKFDKKGNEYTLKAKNEHLTTQTFILYE